MKFIFNPQVPLNTKPGVDYHTNVSQGFTPKFHKLLDRIEAAIHKNASCTYTLYDVGTHIMKEAKRDGKGNQFKFGNILIRYLQKKENNTDPPYVSIAVDIHVNLRIPARTKPAPRYSTHLPLIVTDFENMARWVSEMEKINLDNFRSNEMGFGLFPDQSGTCARLFEDYLVATEKSSLPGKETTEKSSLDSWSDEEKHKKERTKKRKPKVPPVSDQKQAVCSSWEDEISPKTPKSMKLNPSSSSINPWLSSCSSSTTTTVQTNF